MWFRIDNRFHSRIEVEQIGSRPNYYTHKTSRITWLFACHRTLSFIGCWYGQFNRIEEQEKQANQNKVTRDEVEAAFLRSDDTVCRQCWDYDTQQQADNIAKEEARKALVAAKSAEGKQEVKPYHLVTLLDLETTDYHTIYLVDGIVSTTQGRFVKTLSGPIPKLPDGVKTFCTDERLAKAILGRFVGEEVPVDAPDGTVTYHIVDVKPHIALPSDPELMPATEVENERLDIYEGNRRWGRDEGRFRSFPAHDDHSDESDAEGNDEPNWLDLSKD